LERSFVEAFSQDAHPTIIPPKNLEQVATPVGEHPKVAGLRLGPELLFDEGVKAAVPTAQVDRFGRQVNLRCPASERDHRLGMQALQ